MTLMKNDRMLELLLSLKKEAPLVIGKVAGKPVTATNKHHVEAVARNARSVLDKLAAQRPAYAVETRSADCIISTVSYKVTG